MKAISAKCETPERGAKPSMWIAKCDDGHETASVLPADMTEDEVLAVLNKHSRFGRLVAWWKRSMFREPLDEQSVKFGSYRRQWKKKK